MTIWPKSQLLNPLWWFKRSVCWNITDADHIHWWLHVEITSQLVCPLRPKGRNRKLWKDEGRWEHDKFREEEQAPKSREELIAIYGYDIRNGGGHGDRQYRQRRPRWARRTMKVRERKERQKFILVFTEQWRHGSIYVYLETYICQRLHTPEKKTWSEMIRAAAFLFIVNVSVICIKFSPVVQPDFFQTCVYSEYQPVAAPVFQSACVVIRGDPE